MGTTVFLGEYSAVFFVATVLVPRFDCDVDLEDFATDFEASFDVTLPIVTDADLAVRFVLLDFVIVVVSGVDSSLELFKVVVAVALEDGFCDCFGVVCDLTMAVDPSDSVDDC